MMIRKPLFVQVIFARFLSAEITKVTDLKEIMALGVMMTPALAVNGKVKVAGRLPSAEEIKKLLV
jgi:protein-disulfide isomerase